MKKILAVYIKKYSEQELMDIQKELIKNGYEWVSNSSVQNYISGDYIVVINDIMYTMTTDNVKYLSKDFNIIKINDVSTYFRILKIKKIINNEKFN